MLAFIKRWRQYSFTTFPRSRRDILSPSDSGNAATRTKLLNKYIAKVTKDLSLLKVLIRDLNGTSNLIRTQEIQQVEDSSGDLESDLSECYQFRDSFNSSFWNKDIKSIDKKLQKVKSLLDLWEFNMFKLVSMKKNIVNQVDAIYQLFEYNRKIAMVTPMHRKTRSTADHQQYHPDNLPLGNPPQDNLYPSLLK